MHRIASIVGSLLVFCLCQVGVAETPDLSRQEHLSRAANHLEAAGLGEKAAEIRRFAMVEELTIRAKKLAEILTDEEELFDDTLGNSPGMMLEQSVLADTLSALRNIQENLERISQDTRVVPDKVTRNPRELGVQGALQKRDSTSALTVRRESREPPMLMLTPMDAGTT